MEEIGDLPEYLGTINFIVNGKDIICPRFAHVNGNMVPGTYSIQSGDRVEILNYYLLSQVLEFMDLEYYRGIKVNNELANENTKIYENFKIEYHAGDILSQSLYEEDTEDIEDNTSKDNQDQVLTEDNSAGDYSNVQNGKSIVVIVNKQPVVLKGKESYIYVDILDFYPFDTRVAGGKDLIMTVNDEKAEFSTPIHDGDIIEIYWEK